jgi:inhibitor of cysteine peptidase
MVMRTLQHRSSIVVLLGRPIGLLYAILWVMLILIAGCGSINTTTGTESTIAPAQAEGTAMSAITLTEGDSGKVVDIPQGHIITIQLPENPTTGFRWAVDKRDDQVVVIEHDDYTSTGAGIGSGGTHTFTLKAVRPGSAQFRLKLWREWEGDASITNHFDLTIRVT